MPAINGNGHKRDPFSAQLAQAIERDRARSNQTTHSNGVAATESPAQPERFRERLEAAMGRLSNAESESETTAAPARMEDDVFSTRLSAAMGTVYGDETPDRDESDESVSRRGDDRNNDSDLGSDDEVRSAGPVGAGDHVVRNGDCISSIGERHGYLWDTLWRENAELQSARRNPNTLLAGDRVTLPEKNRKQQPAPTEQRHRFRKKGLPSHLRVCLKDFGDRPRAGEPYTLIVDGRAFEGTTDAEGKLEHLIPGDARRGILTVGDERDEYELLLGHLDPSTELSGMQGRLNNLGYDAGSVDDRIGPRTAAALALFQSDRRLPVTGKPDGQTVAALVAAHGS